ncbi:hypothetical protein [Amycolatopsis sp.]|uniref:hypothetical protein n=1 Tax=Amycolatopsis sp. TaxID=37632 RepID=UPI002C60E793|nr:hypothetical protein [Amycolatopsis sp.]HVV12163.1 hypothetical protein [Amycolatopsis sp.]
MELLLVHHRIAVPGRQVVDLPPARSATDEMSAIRRNTLRRTAEIRHRFPRRPSRTVASPPLTVVDGMASLRHAIETTPIPGAPPRLSHQGAAIGLALLDTSLRLNHVRRLTERLTVVEHGSARRITEVDVGLKLLDEGQRQAAAGLQDLLGHEHGVRTSAPGPHRQSLWVPLARLPRRDVSPVDVYDSAGRKLPRLTQHEASRLIASGLYLLLRGILSSDEHAQSAKQDLNTFLFQVHEPRWLVQQALLTLLTERNHPDEEFVLPPAAGTVPGYGRQCREMALRILDDYADLLVEYAQLLDVAVRDYLLVVSLDDSVDEHRLSYETPLHVDAKAPWWTDQWQRLLASRRGYFVGYETTVPATLKSYHLVASTSPEAEIGRMYLSTDSDRHLVDGLAADLRSLAERKDAATLEESGGATHKILELQAQTVLRKLADLLRRRKWEAGQSGVGLPPESLPACHDLAAAATTGDAVRTETNELDNSLLRHPQFTVENLRAAAAELLDRDFGRDLVLVSTVTDNEARAYWRRSGSGDVRGEQVHVRAGLVLKDSTKSGPLNVMIYALAVAMVSFVLGWLLAHSPWPYGREATEALSHIGDGQSVITMLLLVPGFLYTRLSLPPRRTVVGYLGTLPRALGQLSIAAAAAFAATIATQSTGRIVQISLTVAVGLPVLTALLLLGQRSWHESAVPLSRIGVPRWVGAGERKQRRPRDANVRFDSSGGRDGASARGPARIDPQRGRPGESRLRDSPAAGDQSGLRGAPRPGPPGLPARARRRLDLPGSGLFRDQRRRRRDRDAHPQTGGRG